MGQMLPQVVGRNQTVAVQKQQIWSLAGPHPLIATSRELEAFVRVRGEVHGKRNTLSKLAHHFGRFLGRAVAAGNDESASDQRREAREGSLHVGVSSWGRHWR